MQYRAYVCKCGEEIQFRNNVIPDHYKTAKGRRCECGREFKLVWKEDEVDRTESCLTCKYRELKVFNNGKVRDRCIRLTKPTVIHEISTGCSSYQKAPPRKSKAKVKRPQASEKRMDRHQYRRGEFIAETPKVVQQHNARIAKDNEVKEGKPRQNRTKKGETNEVMERVLIEHMLDMLDD